MVFKSRPNVCYVLDEIIAEKIRIHTATLGRRWMDLSKRMDPVRVSIMWNDLTHFVIVPELSVRNLMADKKCALFILKRLGQICHLTLFFFCFFFCSTLIKNAASGILHQVGGEFEISSRPLKTQFRKCAALHQLVNSMGSIQVTATR